MRRAVLVATLALAVAATPGVASADVIFDPADAEELAATLAEAHEKQGVCYGWAIDVNNEGSYESSYGSNFGAGERLSSGDCKGRVEFVATITWTSESSESEDSASYSVVSDSASGRPSTGDLDDLDIVSEDGLEGDDVDSDVYKAVAALPLLAADAGMAEPIEASPAPEADSGDAAPTNSPGSDFWRESGMLVLWSSVLLLAGGVFAWYAFASSRRRARPLNRAVGPPLEQLPPPGPATAQGPAGAPAPDPGRSAAGPTPRPADQPADKPDPETRPGE